jgi:hypothetical protein
MAHTSSDAGASIGTVVQYVGKFFGPQLISSVEWSRFLPV